MPLPQCPLITLITRVEVALEREVEGDLFLQDIGQGFGFRPGSFDGAIRCAIFFSASSCKTILCLICFQYIRDTMAPDFTNVSSR